MVADSDEDGKRRRQACKTEGANAKLAVTCKIGPSFIMSKRSAPTEKPVNAPVTKKSRLDIDTSITEVNNISTELLEKLKQQKNALGWGQAVNREDIAATIAKTETLITSTAKLEQKASDSASRTVNDFINATICTEIAHLFRLFREEPDYDDIPDDQDDHLRNWITGSGCLLEELIVRQVQGQMQGPITHEMPVAIKKATKVAFKERLSQRMLAIIDRTFT
ncbi:hypothetical protein D6C79_06882 [Aureobasidium pullulans]|nr:hypothetical protein D6C79_06882 [Aureobasidium pullulans]